MIFGAHMSTSGGVWKALERGETIGCDIVQIFVGSISAARRSRR